jgi:hypothetical protein
MSENEPAVIIYEVTRPRKRAGYRERVSHVQEHQDPLPGVWVSPCLGDSVVRRVPRRLTRRPVRGGRIEDRGLLIENKVHFACESSQLHDILLSSRLCCQLCPPLEIFRHVVLISVYISA